MNAWKWVNQYREVPLPYRILLWFTVSAMIWLGASPLLTARNERFWMILPVVISVAMFLQIISPPKWNFSHKIISRLMMAIMLSFPALFYLGLVYLTNSPFSWSEVIICVYFFAVCIELPLLYFFHLVTKLQHLLQEKFSSKFAWLSAIFVKGIAYLILIPCLLALFAIHRPKLLSQIPTLSENAQMVELTSIDSSRIQLRGVYEKVRESRGIVLVCHGVGANRTDIAPIVELIQQSGYSTFSFDFRGHGRSSGHTVTYGFYERYDVLAAYRYLSEQTERDHLPIFAYGVSMGASSLLLALPEMPEVKAVFIDSAYADLGMMVEHQLRWFPHFIRLPMVGISRMFGWLETGVDLGSVRPVDSLSQISQPITIIHGERDQIVLPVHAEMLKAKCLQLHEFKMFATAGHIEAAFWEPADYQTLIRHTFVTPAGTERKKF